MHFQDHAPIEIPYPENHLSSIQKLLQKAEYESRLVVEPTTTDLFQMSFETSIFIRRLKDTLMKNENGHDEIQSLISAKEGVGAFLAELIKLGYLDFTLSAVMGCTSTALQQQIEIRQNNLEHLSAYAHRRLQEIVDGANGVDYDELLSFPIVREIFSRSIAHRTRYSGGAYQSIWRDRATVDPTQLAMEIAVAVEFQLNPEVLHDLLITAHRLSGVQGDEVWILSLFTTALDVGGFVAESPFPINKTLAAFWDAAREVKDVNWFFDLLERAGGLPKETAFFVSDDLKEELKRKLAEMESEYTDTFLYNDPRNSIRSALEAIQYTESLSSMYEYDWREYVEDLEDDVSG